MRLGAATVLLLLYLTHVSAAGSTRWAVARSSHFEVYSESGENNAQSTLLWLERLRSFFISTGIAKDDAGFNGHGLVRVIGFSSPKEYAAVRPSPSADAFFLAGEDREYLVLPQFGSAQFAVAAHEYAHLVLHSLGLRVPVWLSEGLAEFFSTVQVTDRACFIGGDLPMRKLALRQNGWLPFETLLSADSPMRADRKQTDVFYAQSWALTDMLIFSAQYRSRFAQFMGEMVSGWSDSSAFERIYGVALSKVMADLRVWAGTPRSGVPLGFVPSASISVATSPVTDFEAGLMMANLFLAAGRVGQAESLYRALAKEQPNEPAVHGALAIIAARSDRQDAAREEWKRAMKLGIRDATLCYEYATLSEDAGLPLAEVREALVRAIELAPDSDNARYKRGLLETHAGNNEAAVEQFRAMRFVAAARAFGYWTAMASALTDLEKRDEAKAAAAEARRYAGNAEERAVASRLAYEAVTDLTVQVARDGQGNLQMVTTRKPHGDENWNPFIEAGDRIRHVEGRIRKVECSGGKISGFQIASASDSVEIALPDPSHVLIQGGDPEFICDAEDGREVAIDFAAGAEHGAAGGLLRGMRFQ